MLAAPPPPDGTLYRGDAGIALAFAYLDAADPQEVFANATARHCERAVAAIGATLHDASLHGGLAGVGWLLEHLRREGRCALEIEGAPALRDAVFVRLARPDAAMDVDLSTGVAGIGVYAVELGDLELLTAAVRRLGEQAERHDHGVAWRTRAAALSEPYRTVFPDGVLDLGVAHGVAGTLAALSAASAASVVGARALLESAVDWLLAQPRPRDGVGRFATWGLDSAADVSARAAWCYGDPGIACALAAAGGVGVDAARAAAVETARMAALRSADTSRVADAAICHGSAGLAVIFARLSRAIGSAELQAATTTWTLRTIDYLERDGFGPHRMPAEPICFAGSGLLSGAAGVLLALLSVATHVGAAWDRALALSVP